MSFLINWDWDFYFLVSFSLFVIFLYFIIPLFFIFHLFTSFFLFGLRLLHFSSARDMQKAVDTFDGEDLNGRKIRMIIPDRSSSRSRWVISIMMISMIISMYMQRAKTNLTSLYCIVLYCIVLYWLTRKTSPSVSTIPIQLHPATI